MFEPGENFLAQVSLMNNNHKKLSLDRCFTMILLILHTAEHLRVNLNVRCLSLERIFLSRSRWSTTAVSLLVSDTGEEASLRWQNKTNKQTRSILHHSGHILILLDCFLLQVLTSRLVEPGEELTICYTGDTFKQVTRYTGHTGTQVHRQAQTSRIFLLRVGL